MTEKSTAAEDFRVELSDDEHGTEMCERWADRLALARMHFARGDLKACQREIDEAARYAALAWQHFFPSPRAPCGAFSIFASVYVGRRVRSASTETAIEREPAGPGWGVPSARCGGARLCGKIQASSEVSAARVGRQRYPPPASRPARRRSRR